MKKLLSLVLAVLMLASLCGVAVMAEPGSAKPAANASDAQTDAAGEDKTGQSDTKQNDYEGLDYQDYLESHKGVPAGTQEIVVDASHLSSKTAGVVIKDNYDGVAKAVYTSDTDTVTFRFTVPQEGFYNLYLQYHTEEGKNVSIERSLSINGEVPFDVAQYFTFTRLWRDIPNYEETGNAKDGYFLKDAYGNDIRPSQEELFQWTGSYFYDYLGYYSDPLEFYFKAGVNTITLAGSKEPVTIGSITLRPAQAVKSYAQVKEEYAANGYTNYTGDTIKIEAEKPAIKSDQTLYPYSDTSTPSTEPYESYKMRINAIGSVRWQYAQQAISWEMEVPADGLYAINFKARKNQYQGMISSRKLYIDGEIPFEEAAAISFKFSNNWVYTTVETADEEECLFYLTKGKHTLTLETTQGTMGPLLKRAEDSLSKINEIYRKIIIVTGTDPDKYRDYKLDELMPDVIEEMQRQAGELDAIVQGILDYTGKKGSDLATLETMSRQLVKMYKKPGDIPKNLSYFKTNIGSLGTWLNTASNAPLELDTIYVSAPETKLEPANKNFWDNIVFQVNQFIASFVVDYNAIGNMTKEVDKNDTITVWIQTGRDQFQTLRAMINDKFTKVTGQEVNLELVNMGALLPAVVAGIGPDVALGQAQNEPVNYALRNAVMDISGFDGFDEVTKRFSSEALRPYYFNNGKKTGVYALPETQSFNVLFYRKDVLDELGIAVPNTWEELITAVTELNKNNLEFGMPVPTTGDPGAGVMTFYSLLRQNGGEMYNEAGTASKLAEDAATTAFKKWTNYYVNYGLPLQFDFQNRFRTGEMPLGIANYTLYNTLAVAAPEIRGLWDFTLIPGTVQNDGTIDRSNTLVTTCCLILQSSTKGQLAWNFLEWWTRAETQSQYGSELECILGPSARYNTANIEAFEQLPWSNKEIQTLNAQLATSYTIPEVPGGYFLQRHINNAFRSVVYKKTDPKDTLLDYSNTINSEITAKREEFGLETASTKK